MKKAPKKKGPRKVSLESLDAKIDNFRVSVVSGFESMNERFLELEDKVVGLESRFDRLESEMMKMRDDIRAVDSKVSGIWNVIDVHAERIKQLETSVQRLLTRK